MGDANGGLVQLTIDDDGVAVLELTRGDRANCMDGPMFAALADSLDAIRADTGTRAVVLCGEGRHFCAGGDLDHPLFDDDDEASRRDQITAAYTVTDRLLDLPQPIVSAIQGRCAGAGLALALATDVRIASESAVFSLDFVRLGLAPDMGVCYLLGSTVGTGRALEMTMTGDLYTAIDARDVGIVSRIAPDDGERPSAMAVARRMAEHPPMGLAAIRSLIRTAPYLDRAAAFQAEIDTMTRLSATGDARQRLDAFRQRSRVAG